MIGGLFGGLNPFYSSNTAGPLTRRNKIALIGVAGMLAGVAVRMFWPDQAPQLRATVERGAQPHDPALAAERGTYR